LAELTGWVSHVVQLTTCLTLGAVASH